MQPLLTIVIANYNYGRFLEEAIHSIISQDMNDKVELIICDAASSDNSVEIIKKYANGLPPNTLRSEWVDPNSQLSTPNSQLISWWCSEKDKGQSDAFNKGFASARGKYGFWLNADDILMPGALKRILEYLHTHPGCEWLAGSTVYGDAQLKVWKCSRCVKVWPFLGKFSPASPVNGPSSIFLIDNLEKVGGFDVDAHYVMDVDLWRRFRKNGIRLHFIKDYIWCFRLHEGSKTASTITEHKVKNRNTDESDRINLRYGATRRVRRVSEWINRFQRLVSGSYLKSYLDTYKYKGKFISEVCS